MRNFRYGSIKAQYSILSNKFNDIEIVFIGAYGFIGCNISTRIENKCYEHYIPIYLLDFYNSTNYIRKYLYQLFESDKINELELDNSLEKLDEEKIFNWLFEEGYDLTKKLGHAFKRGTKLQIERTDI